MKGKDRHIPKVSIVMPVYNGEKFLEETMKSILNQTFKDFEYVIINDGSKDNTLKIIKKHKDKRIRLINNKKNQGFANSLNIGLKAAKGKYIASSNSDDLSHPKRIETQFNYLESHPNIFLIGTSAIFINEKGREINRFRKYDDYRMLAWRLRRACSIAYPSIMFRNEGELSFEKHFGGATDYHFYFKLLKRGKNLTNIPQFLIKYRVHANNMTIYNRKQQERLRDEVIVKFRKLDNRAGFFRSIYYSIKLFIHYIKTMKEKKILS